MRKATLAIIIILLLLISLYGYYGLIKNNDGAIANAIKEKKQIIVYERNIEPKVYFTPETNITPVFISLIENSAEIRCALYDVDYEPIVEALKKKDAKVAVEDENFDGDFTTGKSSGAMHNKFCVFDNKTIITGSTNINFEGINRNDNDFLIINSEYIAKNYLEEFDEIYKKDFAKGSEVNYPVVILNNKTKISNYFCPEDNCQKQVLLEISAANKSIYFMTFSFTDKEIAEELIKKNIAGLDVQGVFEKNRYNSQYEVYKYLNESNLRIYSDQNKYVMHLKAFIIDNETIITGSYNPTSSGDKRNDENIIIIKDKEIAKEYLQEFERLRK